MPQVNKAVNFGFVVRVRDSA
uniref:Uncharacterized protein n=1 Tax=Anguilla anguilla TaxID=7936 RepID=A0A0E9U8Z5_ANGAN